MDFLDPPFIHIITNVLSASINLKYNFIFHKVLQCICKIPFPLQFILQCLIWFFLYQYLELRFKSRAVRLMGTFIGIVSYVSCQFHIYNRET